MTFSPGKLNEFEWEEMSLMMLRIKNVKISVLTFSSSETTLCWLKRITKFAILENLTSQFSFWSKGL